MSKPIAVALVLAAAVVAAARPGATRSSVELNRAAAGRVELIDRRDDRRVEVVVDGKPFTAYRYPTTLQKPVLYPIVSAGGAVITRGYPLEPRPGEAADHPHHVGHWFNYGDVNGYDFWGHSDATPAANKPKMGVIVHTAIASMTSGEHGVLEVLAEWRIPDGSVLLRERTRFEFSGAADRREIDRTTTWTADRVPVTFKDTKEGAFGIRVARALDHPSAQPLLLVGADGNPEKKPRVDTSQTTNGEYLASDGKRGEAVWGTRGPWMALNGTIERRPITVAILDHPSNHGYPTYWHARGYGLFAANPFGRQGFDPGQPPAVFTLQPGQATTFRHRIIVADSRLGVEALAQAHAAFGAAGR